MDAIDLLVVGPAKQRTGGIARFLTEQRERLPAEVSVRVYDGGTVAGAVDSDLATLLASLVAMLRFPFTDRPDVVHVHTSHGLAFHRASWYVFVAKAVWRRPVVVHIHGSSFETFSRRDSGLADAVQRRTFSYADAVIALSEHWREVLAERIDPSKLTVVPNAVDPAEYAPEYGARPARVVFVSNHIERKGIREFVAAVRRLEDADLDVVVAGAGPLSGLAEELAAERDTVEYRGYVSEAEKRRLISSATVYVLPTYAEGLPIALLEGMAGGNAVVTTDVGAIPEVLDEESGWMLEPGEVTGLADALDAVANAPEQAEAMGRHNRAIVEARYSWPVVVGRLVDLYRSVVEEPADDAVATSTSEAEAGRVGGGHS
jgi:glycosyltransferase involved in cell wall biosynthesis